MTSVSAFWACSKWNTPSILQAPGILHSEDWPWISLTNHNCICAGDRGKSLARLTFAMPLSLLLWGKNDWIWAINACLWTFISANNSAVSALVLPPRASPSVSRLSLIPSSAHLSIICSVFILQSFLNLLVHYSIDLHRQALDVVFRTSRTALLSNE